MFLKTTDRQIQHAGQLAKETLKFLDDLQEIDRLGISEQSKRQRRNVLINEMRIKNIDIINELDVAKHTSSNNT